MGPPCSNPSFRFFDLPIKTNLKTTTNYLIFIFWEVELSTDFSRSASKIHQFGFFCKPFCVHQETDCDFYAYIWFPSSVDYIVDWKLISTRCFSLKGFIWVKARLQPRACRHGKPREHYGLLPKMKEYLYKGKGC